MVVYSGTIGDCWRVMVANKEAIYGPATNLQDFGATLGALSGHFWVMRVALGLLWGYCELTSSLLLAYQNVFGMLMVSSRVYEGQISKTFRFPNEF